MRRVFRGIGPVALALAVSGCGEGNVNSTPDDVNTAEYGKKSGDKMKDMYGLPKAEKSSVKSPSDMMRDSFKKK